ncbi:MAG: hypothetical protein O9266_08985 [Porphyrobacter sp.]|jgi:hypothetical protein|nr:hypothetical protein [Porphyrobacter sp.]
MAIVSGIFTLAFLAGLAMLFGFIANHAFKRRSPARRAGYAAVALGVLLTIPAFVALIGSGAGLLPIIAVAVGTAIFAALAFPLALVVTKRKPAEPDQSVFD